MTVITLTTVGFGEIIDMSDNPADAEGHSLLKAGLGRVTGAFPAPAPAPARDSG